MNAELKALFDKKGKIVNEMKDSLRLVSERKGDYAGVANPDEKAKFNAWDNELLQIQEQIDVQERMERMSIVEGAAKAVRVEADGNKEKEYKDAATRSERRNAIDKAEKSGYTALNEEERAVMNSELRDQKAFEKFLRKGFSALDADERNVITRAQSTTTTAGGYTIPEGFAGRIVEYMAKVSDLMNWATILRTDTGNTIPFPINDDNSNTGELIGENSDLSSSTADLVFSVYNLSAHKMSSKMVKVSNELIQDNGVNLLDYLAKRLGIRLGKISNSYSAACLCIYGREP